jgi:tryptophan synthase alpha chain
MPEMSSFSPPQGRLGLMTHMVAGYPSLEDNRRMLQVYADAGVDLLEVQMPFSEPIADGPLFVRANLTALQNGMNWAAYVELLEEAGELFPGRLLMMGYANSLYTGQRSQRFRALAAAGVRALIIPDLPPDSDLGMFAEAMEHGLAKVLLVAPNTSTGRLQELQQYPAAMVYAVARRGVTGVATSFSPALADYLQRLRHYFHVPLAVGFGISTSDQIRWLRAYADFAVIGSAALRAYENGGSNGLRQFLTPLLAACHYQS